MKLQANLQLVGHDPIILILKSSVMDGSQLHPSASCFLNAPPGKKKLKKQTTSRMKNYSILNSTAGWIDDSQLQDPEILRNLNEPWHWLL